MLKKHLAAGIAATALMTLAATAQTTAPTQPAGQGQIMTQMPKDLIRGSKLMGVDVYGADNQKIGDVDEVLVDRQGKIHGIVVGVGGFLGIGKKDVAIPYEQVQWMSSREVQASSAANQGTNTAGGVTTPNAPATNGPAATGSTGMTGTAGSGASTSAASDDTAPARAMVKMTKADLQNAPEFQYSDEANRGSAAGGTGNTNPPPASANRPGNAPQQ